MSMVKPGDILVHSFQLDHGVGKPFEPHWVTHYIYKAAIPEYGNTHYVTIDPEVSITWLTPAKLAALLISHPITDKR